jgi:putative ABC transport system substrate-binding protein
MRSLLRIALGLLCLAAAPALAQNAPSAAGKKIGVLLSNTAGRYHDARDAVLSQLKKEGFGEEQASFLVENGLGDKAKLAELAKNFAAAKVDLVVAVGTPAVLAAAAEMKETPIVFTIVYDPVDAKIAADWASSGNNTTGVSSKVALPDLIGTLKAMSPVKRLLVLYTPGEKNSEAQLKDLEGMEKSSGLDVVPVPLARPEDLPGALAAAKAGSDAVYLTGSSVITKSASRIAELANKAKVLTVTHLDEFVDQGVALGVCGNSYTMGRAAGSQAAQILKGKQPAALPIERPKKIDVIVNNASVKLLQLKLSPEFTRSITKAVN